MPRDTVTARSGRSGLSDPSLWVERHGDCLYRYAMVRVRDAELAEDLVQETLLAALNGRDRFTGRASERTWLVSILRHKLVDHLRAAHRGVVEAQAGSSGGPVDEFFDRRGMWTQTPARWPGDPARLAEQREFQDAFQDCLSKLPKRLADAFSLREVCQLSSQDVCKVLGISPTNLWTQLHRARLLLHRCLDENWYRSTVRGRKR